ncbi:unnamed protein product [Linum trigynum]|uniref:Uncharacterized protein n=1 Tax=Linum trigynum TaxID=586398 RepID=A0AAV2E6K5_9ROSI
MVQDVPARHTAPVPTASRHTQQHDAWLLTQNEDDGGRTRMDRTPREFLVAKVLVFRPNRRLHRASSKGAAQLPHERQGGSRHQGRKRAGDGGGCEKLAGTSGEEGNGAATRSGGGSGEDYSVPSPLVGA